MLKDMCDLIGVSGYEESVVQYINTVLANGTEFEVYKDNVGNLICHKAGTENSKRILIMSHVDEVGFQITRKMDENCFEFKTLGNVKAWNLNQQRMRFGTGEKGVVYAKDETAIGAKNFDNLYVRILDDDDRIEVGDTFAFENCFCETTNCYVGKALDNRLCCWGLVQAVLENYNFKNDIYAVFTVQEEIGLRGAKVSVSSIKPDIVIDLDVSPVGQYNNLLLGEGVGLKISDGLGVSDAKLVRWILAIAQQKNIALQREVSDCGASEMVLMNETDLGSRNVGLSIPCKFMHTANTVVNKSDFENFCKLLQEIMKSI